jgi:hypothetical protein
MRWGWKALSHRNCYIHLRRNVFYVVGKILLLLFLLIGCVNPVNASTINSIDLEVNPHSGDITTDILIRVRGEPFNGGFLKTAGEYPVLYVYYDDSIIMSRVAPVIRPKSWGDFSDYEASWDVSIKVPNEHPLSELGVHVIKVIVEASDGSTASEMATFDVVNYIPPPEWWNDLQEDFVESITGPQGESGIDGKQGPKGDAGEPYPKEALYYSIGASSLALLVSLAAFFRGKRRY